MNELNQLINSPSYDVLQHTDTVLQTLDANPTLMGWQKEFHFRAADARYASAALVEMQKSTHLEAPASFMR